MIARLRRFVAVHRTLLLILLAVTLLALPVLTYPLGRDQGEFATLARGILHGRVPYRDLWNPKPPAVFYVYAGAISLFGQTSAAIRLIDLLMFPLIGVTLYSIGGRIGGRSVGLWAALVFGVFYFTETFWTLSQNDGIVLLPMTLAVECAFRAVHFPSPNPFLPQGLPSVVLRREGRRAGLWSILPHPQPLPASEEGRYAGLWAGVCGVLCAVIIAFKYPFALFIPALVGGYVLYGRVTSYQLPVASKSGQPSAISDQQSAKDRFQSSMPIPRLLSAFSSVLSTFLLALGGTLVGGVAYLAAIGAWDELVLSARVTAQYTALTFNWTDFSELMTTALGFRWSHWGLLAVLAGLWFVPPLRKRGAGWGMILLWLAAGLGIMLIQAKGYDYHWLPMLPALALLAGGTIDRMVRGVAGRFTRDTGRSAASPLQSHVPGIYLSLTDHAAKGAGGVIAVGLLAILFAGVWPKSWGYLTGAQSQVEYYHQFQAGEFVADESLEVAEYLRARVVPGDSLFIWGFRPEVYFLTGLNPGCRFYFHFPLVGSWYPPEWREEAVDTLWASLPPYVLVLQVDYMPWVTGSEEDSNTLLQEYTELNDWLIFNYERETQIGNFFVWRRKP